MVAFYAVLMFHYDLVLTGVALVTALLNVAALRTVARAPRRPHARLQQDRGKAIGAAMAGLQTIETSRPPAPRATSSPAGPATRPRRQRRAAAAAHRPAALAVVPPFLGAQHRCWSWALGGLRVMDGETEHRHAVAFQALMRRLHGSGQPLVALGGTLQEVQGRHEPARRRAARRARPRAGDAAGRTTPEDGGGVRQAHRPPRAARRHLRLQPAGAAADRRTSTSRCSPGSASRSSAGRGAASRRSRKLVTGLYEPWAGEILFDGTPRAACPARVLTNSLAVSTRTSSCSRAPSART